MAFFAAVVAVAGCSGGLPKPELGFGQTTQHGYVVSPTALQQVPAGSSKDQVLIALGSPSTTANYGNDVFYYISQTRSRAATFLPERVVDQRVVAVYFDNKNKVARVADYGLQDGKVFDFVSRTTPTAGVDQTFLSQLFSVISSSRPRL
jgi:outer membrane protein assembly factor BamE (lipoprotein component of BamABCDE complex)